jgi:hypothetical protein
MYPILGDQEMLTFSVPPICDKTLRFNVTWLLSRCPTTIGSLKLLSKLLPLKNAKLEIPKREDFEVKKTEPVSERR